MRNARDFVSSDRAALCWYTRRPAYWCACKSGAERIDSPVSPWALKRLAEQLAEYHARAVAIREAARRARRAERATEAAVAGSARQAPTRASLADLRAAAARRRAA